MGEYMQHIVNGWLFKHLDRSSLKEQLWGAINNRPQMQTLVQRGYLYSKDGEVPNIEEYGYQLIKLLEKERREKTMEINS